MHLFLTFCHLFFSELSNLFFSKTTSSLNLMILLLIFLVHFSLKLIRFSWNTITLFSWSLITQPFPQFLLEVFAFSGFCPKLVFQKYLCALSRSRISFSRVCSDLSLCRDWSRTSVSDLGTLRDSPVTNAETVGKSRISRAKISPSQNERSVLLHLPTLIVWRFISSGSALYIPMLTLCVFSWSESVRLQDWCQTVPWSEV